MEDSVYSALFGALSQEHRLNLIANNLANVNTTGYKKDQVAFMDTFVPMAHDRITDSKPYLRADPLWPDADLISRLRLSEQKTDFSQGGLTLTGNPLDVAIQGEGFFKVQRPGSGEVFYTRNGSFLLDADGYVKDGGGNYVLAGGGPLQVPQGAKTLTIDGAGQVRADGAELGTLDVVSVADPGGLMKIGNNLFSAAQGAAAQETPLTPGLPEAVEGQATDTVRATLYQGYLESANVEVVSEMVRMIEVNRTFEAYQKVMTGSQQLDQKLTSIAQRA